MDDTAAQTSTALAQVIYPVHHPLYEIPFEEQLRLLETVTLDQIRDFHQKSYGKQKMIVVAAGDVDETKFEESVKMYFHDWKKKVVSDSFSKNTLPQAKGSIQNIEIPDKVKVDVAFGHGLHLVRTHPDYLPIYLANAILGGDFSARLSNIVRDDLGLTYHIQSEVHGI